MTKTKAVAVLYRLAPEHPYPAALDDAVAVYKELLKTYKPEHIVVYGTSAGAILTAEVAVKLKQLGLPMPAALGIFSGTGDLSRADESIAMYALEGLTDHLDPPSGKVDLDYLTKGGGGGGGGGRRGAGRRGGRPARGGAGGRGRRRGGAAGRH